ncbi:MAG: type II secretion system protein J [Pirellulales bacterium]
MRRNRRRWPAVARGMTLIELILAMGIGASIMAVTAGVLARAVAANSSAAEHLHDLTALGTLGQQFRRDVHAASAATSSNDDTGQPGLLLETPSGGQIRYQVVSSGMTRLETTKGQADRREAFTLSGLRVVGFRGETGGAGPIAIVLARITQRPDGQTVVGAQFELTAVRPQQSAPRQAEETQP